MRTSDSDPTDSLLESLQITQNKFARFVNGTSLSDKINTKTIFKDTKLLSVNQINAQIKLTEVWKSHNIKSYPIQWIKRNDVQKRSGLKTLNKPDLIISGLSHIQSHSFINDAAKVWNEAPRQIKDSLTLSTAKEHIKLYVQTLPI